ncbi:uncharacterized protein LOC133302330 [Gastrolobium bilobum]|uniref:uncharacterized protein LOC133302330 n=1 Tax=Gastrolobium bilobum TaxID=150636 RepID=UPI002AB2F56A|nr:uncharacterized protein LOC133302330 [Gastrolobium bilobum]
MDSAMSTEEHDEWELRHDDGFVYKCKKRRLHPPPSSTDTDEAEEWRRERKKRTLLKLKAKYQSEILQWDTLSNTLRAMHKGALRLQQERERVPERTPSLAYPWETIKGADSDGGSLVDELLLQVEVQEAIIRDVSNLCDVAESMCIKQEEEFKQLLFNLPIWASPHEIMELLCND